MEMKNAVALKRRKRPTYRESDIQKHFFQWLRFAYPDIWRISFAIPNGGYNLSYAMQQKLKNEGRKAGVLDVFIPVGTSSYHGLFIEFKSQGKKPTPEQKEMMTLWTERGYHCVVCYSWEESSESLKRYLNV